LNVSELAACKDLSSCSRSSTRVSPERCIKAPAAIEKSEAVGHDKPVEDESNQPQETAHLKKEKQTIKTEGWSAFIFTAKHSCLC